MEEKREKWRRVWSAAIVAAVIVAAVLLGMFMPGATPHWKKVKVGMPRSEVQELIGKAHQSSDDSTGWTASRKDGYYIEDDQFLRIHYKNEVVTRLQVRVIHE
jgi:hypothetical protein